MSIRKRIALYVGTLVLALTSVLLPLPPIIVQDGGDPPPTCPPTICRPQ